MELLQWFRNEGLGMVNLFRPTLVARICNHETKQEGPVVVGRKTSILTLTVGEDGRPAYCLDCLGKMAIRCVLCEKVIHVGDSIVLHKAESFETLPKHAVRYRYDQEYVIGCTRPRCADTEVIPLPSPFFGPELSPYTEELLVAHRLRRNQ